MLVATGVRTFRAPKKQTAGALQTALSKRKKVTSSKLSFFGVPVSSPYSPEN